MLLMGDVDLNSVQNITDSIKQRLKQTMLDQELVFMGQVYELHRLYRIQVAMMDDLEHKRLESYGLPKGLRNSISSHNSQTRYSMAEFTQLENISSLHEWHKLPGFTQKPLDLQLPADEFISCADDLSEKGVFCHSLKEAFKSRNPSPGDALHLHDLKLSLRTGQDASNKLGINRSCIGKKTTPFTEIIDLEDPKSVFSDGGTYLGQNSGSSAQMTSSTEKYKLESVLQSGTHDSGYYGHRRGLFPADLLSKDQTSNSAMADNLDLNISKLEESSHFSNNGSMMMNPSRIGPFFVSPTSWKKADMNRCPKTQNMPQKLDLNVDLTMSNGDKICFIDLDSDSSEGLKVESVGSLSKPLNSPSCNIDTVDLVGTESNSIKTMQSIVKCGNINISTSDEIQKDDTANSSELDQRYSDTSESNIQFVIREQLEVDETVQRAAESLVQISSKLQELASKESENEENDQPQCSSDSYAELVLNAEESDPNDFFLSSNAFVVDESEKKENRYKLKRGTRMKDFQKDILPGLSILSRHEIHEDINILESIIRSREYKKMKAKLADEGDWCNRPKRSKRSRIRYTRR